MEYKDYYKILGVAKDAGADDIKKAYRRLAHKYHPDVSKAEDAEEKFKEVAEAYATLKDPEKRAAYDALGTQQAGSGTRKPASRSTMPTLPTCSRPSAIAAAAAGSRNAASSAARITRSKPKSRWSRRSKAPHWT